MNLTWDSFIRPQKDQGGDSGLEACSGGKEYHMVNFFHCFVVKCAKSKGLNERKGSEVWSILFYVIGEAGVLCFEVAVYQISIKIVTFSVEKSIID